MNDLVSCSEAAERLGVHVSTIRAWVRTGRVPALRTGQRFIRVSWRDLVRALEDERERQSEKAGGRS